MSKPAAAAASSSSSSASPSPIFPSTAAVPCSHTQKQHVALPHTNKQQWESVLAKLSPLASYYVEHILSAPRGTEAAAAAASPEKGKVKKPIWSHHSVPANTERPPVFPCDKLIEFLIDIKHPSVKSSSITGKSFTLTLDSVLHPADRAHFFQVIVPYLAHLVLQLPTLFPINAHCLPVLIQGLDASVTLSAYQCACLLACQFFSLLPTDGCNFNHFLSVTREPMSGKHILVLNYFARIEDPREGVSNDRFVTFHRRVLPEEQCAVVTEELENQPHALSTVEYCEEGVIEDALHSLQVDFANKYIGGGVLYTGCVQEEIRFCLSPELIVSMVFTDVMNDNEIVALIGSGLYSHYEGYGTSLVFGKDLPDFNKVNPELDEFKRISTAIIAIDAIDYMHNQGSERRTVSTQWKEDEMEREILKAFAGFSYDQKHLGNKFIYDSVATGNWGCGAFGGFVPLKFLLQWIASSLSNRKLIYYSFSNPLAKSIPIFVDQIKKFNPPITTGEMWRALVPVGQTLSKVKPSEISPDRMFQDLLHKLNAFRQQ